MGNKSYKTGADLLRIATKRLSDLTNRLNYIESWSNKFDTIFDSIECTRLQDDIDKVKEQIKQISISYK